MLLFQGRGGGHVAHHAVACMRTWAGVIRGGKGVNELLLDLLTVLKAILPKLILRQRGLQILGGTVTAMNFPRAVLPRPRIHPIHEGTTGIQGITLLGRN